MKSSFKTVTCTARLLILTILLVQIVAASAVADEQSNLSPPLGKMWSLFSDLQVSPNNNYLAFTVITPGTGPKYLKTVSIYNLSTGEVMEMPGGTREGEHPQWSPDGEKLAFVSDAEGKKDIHVMTISTGKEMRLETGADEIVKFRWSPDGERIAYLEKVIYYKKGEIREVHREHGYSRLKLIDVKTGETVPCLKRHWLVNDVLWGPEGDQLVISATQDNSNPDFQTLRIYSVEISTGKVKELLAPKGPFKKLSLSYDGTQLFYLASPTSGPVVHDLFVAGISGGEPSNITGNSLDRTVEDYRVAENGKVVVNVEYGFQNRFYEISTNGKVSRIADGLNTNPSGNFVLTKSGIAFVGESFNAPPEIWLTDGPHNIRQITDINKRFKRPSEYTTEFVTYESFDGKSIDSVLFKPLHSSNKNKAALIALHGGPSDRWSNTYSPEWGDLLARQGYIVLMPNIRGSTGYGNDFITEVRRDWGGADYQDVLWAAKYLIEKGIADKNNLGLVGSSYGGYLTAFAITQTDLFKAAVALAPMTDLAFEYGTERSDVNGYDTWHLGDPYHNLDLFVERSPITQVAKIRAPLLMMCAENDVINPPQQCFEFFRGLRRYSPDSRFIMYPDEGHHNLQWSTLHRGDYMRRTINWFNRYLDKKMATD